MNIYIDFYTDQSQRIMNSILDIKWLELNFPHSKLKTTTRYFKRYNEDHTYPIGCRIEGFYQGLESYQ